MDHRDFITTVAYQAGITPEEAERATRATLATLAERISGGEARDIAAQLPGVLAPCLETREEAEAFDRDEFVRRVAERLGSDRDTAWRAIDAVLDLLARKIAHGEVDDLIMRLPAALAGPLEHGVARGGDDAQPVPVEGFVRGIVEREHVSPREAIEHARAVLATLRDFVGEKEFSDVLAQLPKDYDVLLPRDDERDAAAELRVLEVVELVYEAR